MKDTIIVLVAIGLILFFGLGIYAGYKIATGISCPVIERLDNDLATLQQKYSDLEKEHEANMVIVRATDMLASYYGRREHGNQCADGSTFDMNALTAAHRTMKFGSILILENISNGKICPVQITDRGDFWKHGRDLDVSQAVAERLGMVREGVANLRTYETFKVRPSRRDR